MTDPSVYNKTSLQPSRRSLVIDRDYLAHVLRWAYVVRLVGRRDRKVRRPYRIVDVGCGVEAPLAAVLSLDATLARGRPLSYDGVDVGPVRPTVHRKWVRYHPYTDAIGWAPPEPADLVVCFETVEHMPREHGVRLVASLRGMVRDDGLVLLSTPVRARTLPRNHVYEWALDELVAECERAGFTVDRVFGTFMDIDVARKLSREDPALSSVWDRLSVYYPSEVMACLFTPLFPEASKSVLLVLSPTRDPRSTT